MRSRQKKWRWYPRVACLTFKALFCKWHTDLQFQRASQFEKRHPSAFRNNGRWDQICELWEDGSLLTCIWRVAIYKKRWMTKMIKVSWDTQTWGGTFAAAPFFVLGWAFRVEEPKRALWCWIRVLSPKSALLWTAPSRFRFWLSPQMRNWASP